MSLVSHTHSVREVCSGHQQQFHALVNLAVVVDPGDFMWTNYLSTAQATMDVNYFGTIRLTHALLPIMIEQQQQQQQQQQQSRRQIINVTSVNGVVAVSSNSARPTVHRNMPWKVGVMPYYARN